MDGLIAADNTRLLLLHEATLPDYQLVVVGIVLGTRDPVRVSSQHPHRSTQLPSIPELDLPIIPRTNQHARLVGIEVHAPKEGCRYNIWYYACTIQVGVTTTYHQPDPAS
jgi:hypothetical protein